MVCVFGKGKPVGKLSASVAGAAGSGPIGKTVMFVDPTSGK